MVPVNPAAGEIEGRRSFARVQDIEPAPDGVVVLTSSAVTRDVVDDCILAGVKRIWMCRTAGKGSVSPAAVGACQAHGISVIPGGRWMGSPLPRIRKENYRLVP